MFMAQTIELFMKQSLFTFIKSLREFLANKLNQYNTTLPYVITIIIALVIVVGGINLLVELTETLKTETLATYDTAITDYVIYYRTSGLTSYFKFMTYVGDVYGYLIVLVVFL